jgi:site-specific recombinase XerD
MKICEKLTFICTDRYEENLFRAAYTLSYHGLFRVSEVISTSNSNQPLHYKDISFMGDTLVITLRKSKTNQCGQPTILKIKASTNKQICCLQALQNYIILRPRFDGCLFCHLDRTPLTRYQFSAILSKTLQCIGIPTTNYKSHSFRIGRATDLANMGIDKSEIKKMGRWSSNSYLKYIRS